MSTDMAEIRVQVMLDDLPSPLTPDGWLAFTSQKLRAAGIPLTDAGDLMRGTLVRLDDPRAFDRMEWVWRDGA